MDAVEYVKQRERMCDYCGDCDKCPTKKVIGVCIYYKNITDGFYCRAMGKRTSCQNKAK